MDGQPTVQSKLPTPSERKQCAASNKLKLVPVSSCCCVVLAKVVSAAQWTLAEPHAIAETGIGKTGSALRPLEILHATISNSAQEPMRPVCYTLCCTSASTPTFASDGPNIQQRHNTGMRTYSRLELNTKGQQHTLVIIPPP